MVHVSDKRQGELQAEMDNLSKSCLRKSGTTFLGLWGLALEQTSNHIFLTLVWSWDELPPNFLLTGINKEVCVFLLAQLRHEFL